MREIARRTVKSIRDAPLVVMIAKLSTKGIVSYLDIIRFYSLSVYLKFVPPFINSKCQDTVRSSWDTESVPKRLAVQCPISSHNSSQQLKRHKFQPRCRVLFMYHGLADLGLGLATALSTPCFHLRPARKGSGVTETKIRSTNSNTH